MFPNITLTFGLRISCAHNTLFSDIFRVAKNIGSRIRLPEFESLLCLSGVSLSKLPNPSKPFFAYLKMLVIVILSQSCEEELIQAKPLAQYLAYWAS